MLKEMLAHLPEIETPRLLLRAFVPEDAADLSRWLGREEVYTYWGRKSSRGEREPEKLFVDRKPWGEPDGTLHWAITSPESGVIGDLTVFEIQNRRLAQVGYRLDPGFWGRGVMTEALRAVVQFIYTQTELQRLEATADVRNRASWRVLEKCGFRREGTIRQGKMVSNYCDYHIYGLLREDLDEEK